jgi:hypothetical protein
MVASLDIATQTAGTAVEMDQVHGHTMGGEGIAGMQQQLSGGAVGRRVT